MNSQSQHAAGMEPLTKAARVVVKIGSSLLIAKHDGTINRAWRDSLAGEFAKTMSDGQSVMLVSSGA